MSELECFVDEDASLAVVYTGMLHLHSVYLPVFLPAYYCPYSMAKVR